MKKSIITLLLSSVLGSNIYAGDTITPVETPVATQNTELVSSLYMGIGAVWAKLSACETKKCSYEDVTYGAMLRAGYDYNTYVGAEIRIMRTFLHEGPYGGTPLQHIGLFTKPQYQATEQLNFYTLLGYGYTKNLGNSGRLNYLDSESGFSAGFGLEYALSTDEGNPWQLFIDYQRLLIEADVPDLDVISAGLLYRF